MQRVKKLQKTFATQCTTWREKTVSRTSPTLQPMSQSTTCRQKVKVCLFLTLNQAIQNTTRPQTLACINPTLKQAAVKLLVVTIYQKSGQVKRRVMLNNFLHACNTDTVEPYKKQVEEASERTRASLLLWLVLTLSDLETRAISGRPLKIVAPSRRNQISVNDKKTENISRYRPNPPETHLAEKQGVRYYQSWET